MLKGGTSRFLPVRYSSKGESPTRSGDPTRPALSWLVPADFFVDKGKSCCAARSVRERVRRVDPEVCGTVKGKEKVKPREHRIDFMFMCDSEETLGGVFPRAQTVPLIFDGMIVL